MTSPEDSTTAPELLGEQVAEFRGAFGRVVQNWMLGGFALAGGFIGLWLFSRGKLVTDSQKSAQPFILGLGLIGLLIFVLALIAGLRNRRRSVRVFRGGLMTVSSSGTEVCRWDDVVSVTECLVYVYRQGSMSHSREEYTLDRRDGTSFVAKGPLRDLKGLSQIIWKEVIHRRLPECQAALVRGEIQKFGPFDVDRRGLGHGDNLLPWSAVERVKLTKGAIWVRQTGGALWAAEPVHSTPNALILLALIEQCTRKDDKGKSTL
jgi:hypothetical protein